MKRQAFAVLIGLGGFAILVGLGIWQVQRLAWKQDLLAGIEARIGADPGPLPADPDPETDRYMPVTVTGTFLDGPHARMLASRRQIGAVYRHIVPFETTDGRAMLVDIGWTPADMSLPELPDGQLTLTGNLDWPRETDSFTPEPDLDAQLWYARDVSAMAEEFDTRPILLVLRELPQNDLRVTPWPVDTTGIPNDHLQYAITWFSLAIIWAGMTVLFVLRNRRNAGKG
jgi:surfeit locus 1 family protein